MRIAVFIDGSNFYGKLKEIGIINTSRFDFSGFINKIVGSDNSIVYVGYYVGRIRKEQGNARSHKLYSDQQKMFSFLKINLSLVDIVTGHIQNFNGVYKEKGVDVRIALDLYRLARENFYDKAVLISSDSDLIPAIRMVQDYGKIIEYIGFSHNLSFALLKACMYKKLLAFDDMKPFEFLN